MKRGAWTSRNAGSRPHCDTPLRQWLVDNRMTMAEFARQFGCDGLTAQYWTYGQVLPSYVNAFRLDAFTNGAIPAASWLGTEVGKAEYAKACGARGNTKWKRRNQPAVGDQGTQEGTEPEPKGEAGDALPEASEEASLT